MAYTFSWVPTPGQNNSFVTNNNGTGRSIINSEQYPFNSPLYICIPPITFQGGDTDAVTLYDFAKTIATCGVDTTVQNPGINYNGNRFVGGAFTLNGNPCGRYEYNVLPTTVFNQQSDIYNLGLFSGVNDSVSNFIIVRGDLTIGNGTNDVVLIPTQTNGYTQPSRGTPDPNVIRKLFMLVYVTGNLIVNDKGIISMNGCGANTDTTGANISSFTLPIANNIFASDGGLITTIQMLQAGSSGGIGTACNNNSFAGPTNTEPFSDAFGINGTSTQSGVGPTYINLTTAGGGAGGTAITATGGETPGDGGSGSPFSGGSGGGSINNSSAVNATNGSSRGGQGGRGAGGDDYNFGGTGNPGGQPLGARGAAGNSGTGGVVIVICEGTVTASSGSISASGINGNGTLVSGASGGGGSGGGAIIQVVNTHSSASIPPNTVTTILAGYNPGGVGGAPSSVVVGINS
jgi:hypothetical protein